MLRTSVFLRKHKNLMRNVREITSTSHSSISNHLLKNNIDLIFDIGANIGQFGIDMRNNGFEGRLISYEPASNLFRELYKTARRHSPWDTFPIALGSSSGIGVLNLSGNRGLSSSLLEMNETHLYNFPDSFTIGREQVNISTFDEQIDSLDISPNRALLKLDVQGYELEVLKGATTNLSKVPFCFLEVSLTPMYKNEASLVVLLNYLFAFGHEVIDIFRGIKSSNGELLQIDILTKNRNQEK